MEGDGLGWRMGGVEGRGLGLRGAPGWVEIRRIAGCRGEIGGGESRDGVS